ncbi:MAG TPA: class I SAM-dependent methyltransferase [Pirellulales bacterium]|nr:class I SAM-dependent methyltransferase [Pirellulales bacterium]
MSIHSVDLSLGFHRDGEQPVHVLKEEREIFFRLFDDVQRRLNADNETATIHGALDELFLALREKKTHSNDREWQAFIDESRVHPISTVLHKDPFTYRAFSKPRGYAGDAVMMDFIYGREEQWPLPQAEPLGQAIFEYTTGAPASEGVRARRAFIAARIDRLAEKIHHPDILSIASGHLREVSLSAAVRRRRTGRFIALDADAESAAEVANSYGRFGVETVTSSFRRLLVDQHEIGKFDFVYSTGLFDYLTQRAGRRLVTSMFRALKPGGTLLVANFLPCIRDIGYMETFMDWQLVYRSRRDMVELTMDIPEEEVKQVTVFSEECRNIVFLQLTRV